jgi:hypothetical protein
MKNNEIKNLNVFKGRDDYLRSNSNGREENVRMCGLKYSLSLSFMRLFRRIPRGRMDLSKVGFINVIVIFNVAGRKADQSLVRITKFPSRLKG